MDGDFVSSGMYVSVAFRRVDRICMVQYIVTCRLKGINRFARNEIRRSDFAIDTISAGLYNIPAKFADIVGWSFCMGVSNADRCVSCHLKRKRRVATRKTTTIENCTISHFRRADGAKIGYRSLQLPRFLIR